MNGKIQEGWNFVTIAKSDIYTTGFNDNNLKRIFLKLVSRGTVLEENTFAHFIFDSVVFDLKATPSILINFDQLWQESVNNNGYKKLFDNNIPATLFTKNYKNLLPTQIEQLKEMMDFHGWEISLYSNVGEYNGLIERATSYTDAKDVINNTIADIVETMNIRPRSFAATQSVCNIIGKTSLIDSGFVGIRYGGGLPQSYFGALSGFRIPHEDISAMTLDKLKEKLDKTIETGTCWCFFTHGICDDGETMMHYDNGSLSSSSGIPISVFNSFVDYLKQKIDEGEIQAITFEEYFRQCGV